MITNEEELDELLVMLTKLQYIEREAKELVKDERVAPQDVFSLRSRSLLLIILNRADELRKYEEKEKS